MRPSVTTELFRTYPINPLIYDIVYRIGSIVYQLDIVYEVWTTQQISDLCGHMGLNDQRYHPERCKKDI
jgi:hypothetical protein